jgi:hypothetical protein
MTMIKIHNVETGEIIEREATTEELAQREIDETQTQVVAQAQATKAAEKAALLERLGLTQDEALLLLS